MRALLRAIAFALHSWLNSVRGRLAARRAEGQVGGGHRGGVSLEARSRVEDAEPQASVAAPTTENLEGAALPAKEAGLPNRCNDAGESPVELHAADVPHSGTTCESNGQAVGGRNEDHDGDVGIPQVGVVDVAATVKAEDLLTSEPCDEVSAPPGEPGDPSDDGARARSVGQETAGPDAETDLKQAGEQEAHDAAETGTPAEHLAERREGDGPADYVGQLPDESENEKIVASSGEASSEINDPQVGTDFVDAPETGAEEDFDAPEPDAGEEPDFAPASDEVIGEVIEEGQVSTSDGRAIGSDADVLNAGPEADDRLEQPPTREKLPRRAPQYRAPVGGPPPRRQPSKPRSSSEDASRSPTRGRPAVIEVRVIFQRGGYCNISLLPKRLPGLPEELAVSSAAGDVELRALQDDWYQDVVPDNLGGLLRTGFVWKHGDTGQEWLLSGREVFVLAHGTTHRGFVSCPRLAVGRDHVVLCTATQLSEVEAVLRTAGCAGWIKIGEDDGVPSGWRVLRGVVPQNPVPQSGDADILNILRPLPEIEIALEGGIRLAYNSWLLGYPPAIQIYGDPEHTESVLIDGQEATESEQGGFTAQGWHAEGDHQIWCSSSNKSYSLVRCEASWTYWPAYSFALRGAGGEGHEFEICGPLVRPVATDAQSTQRQVVQVAPANPVLLGASPGDVFFVRQRPEVRGAMCLGLPPFDPVWALPAQPLTCDKRTNRILLVGEPTARCGDASWPSAKGGHDLERWCRLVLDASRKGLAVEPASPATHGLWREYKQLGRNLWRRLRR